MLDDRNLMPVMRETIVGVWNLFDKDLNFPQPIGSMDMKTIVSFFAVCYIFAYVIRSIGERRD